jgi:diguanylate cyclase (GGDEF)-like protein
VPPAAASPDPLTGLPTRTHLLAALEHELAADSGPVGLLFLDLDGFKAVNDRLGHAAGDALLRAAAGRLRAAVRAQDVVARLGGDEFAVLVRGPGSSAGLRAVGERVAAALRQPYLLAGGLGRTTCPASVGAALDGGGGAAGAAGAGGRADRDVPARARALLHAADQAMYAAKTTGTDVADAVDAPPRLAPLAVRRLGDGTLVRVAVRPVEPTPPDALLRAVLGAVLALRCGPGGAPVSVPLPSEDCLSATGARRLLAAAARAGVDPSALAVQAAPPRRGLGGPTREDVRSGRDVLAHAGVRLVLADAAGGWSARDLLGLRPEEAVLDAGLLHAAALDAGSREVARAWVALAHAAGASVTAGATPVGTATAGPGTTAHLTLAAALGCDAVHQELATGPGEGRGVSESETLGRPV